MPTAYAPSMAQRSTRTLQSSTSRQNRARWRSLPWCGPPRRRGPLRTRAPTFILMRWACSRICQPTIAPRSLPHRAASTSSLLSRRRLHWPRRRQAVADAQRQLCAVGARFVERLSSVGAVGEHAVSNGDGGLREGGKGGDSRGDRTRLRRRRRVKLVIGSDRAGLVQVFSDGR